MTFALWIVPSEPEYSALQRLMNFQLRRRSSRTHSHRSYPHCKPHVTLATFSSPPPLLADLLPMAEATPVYFESLRVGSDTLSVVISKSREFVDLHNYAAGHLRRTHGIHVTSRSFPRMPLFSLDDAAHGECLAEILRSSGRVIDRRGMRGVELNCTLDGAAPGFDAMTGFLGSELWLVDCSGTAASWKVLERRNLIRHVPYMPMGAPLPCGPVIPVPSRRRSSGYMPPVSYMQRGEPFSHKPKPSPVIPVPLHRSPEPRRHEYHYPRERNTNFANIPAKKRTWGGCCGFR